MTTYLFDIETDGLLDKLSRIHCLVLQDATSGEVTSYVDDAIYSPVLHADVTGPVSEGLAKLQQADWIVGHNVIRFDLPAIEKVTPGWADGYAGKVRDTLVLTRLMWPEVKKEDVVARKKGFDFPKRLVGAHSLEAWGRRLKCHKGEYSGGWEKWSPEMHRYMLQDAKVTAKLWRKLLAEKWDERSIELEHAFQAVIFRMELNGFPFDEAAATRLYATLAAERDTVRQELVERFGTWEIRTPFVPKANNKKLGYVKGELTEKVKTVEFNPASRAHIVKRLQDLHGWEPDAFTETGQPKVDETVLSRLPYPEAQQLARFFLLNKRIGQLAEGKEALLKHVQPDGRIHGSVVTNGAVTGRCSHSRPNIAQVPKVKSTWGREFRALFHAPQGRALVGTDASGLELRMLAHYLAFYDGGTYAEAVVHGSQSDGTDVHSVNARALGLDPQATYSVLGRQVGGRDLAKTFIYAFLYGAGDHKIGTIVGVTEEEARRAARARSGVRKAQNSLKFHGLAPTAHNLALCFKGAELKERFLAQTPGLQTLRDKIAARVEKRGFLIGLDGRRLTIRSPHAALNTLLQSGGAVAVKQATVLLAADLSKLGYVHGREWELVAHVHDELQKLADEEIADEVGQRAVQAIKAAGESLDLLVPLDGEYSVGRNWAETH